MEAIDLKKLIAAAILAAPILAVAAPGTAWATGDHGNGNPCPVAQRIPVYAQNGNPNGHFVCGPLKGEKGDTGATGATGATGPAGPSGQPGPAGAPGNDGADGLDGATGPAGPQGNLGPQGPAGTNGEDGATGPAGPTGPTGPVGPAGSDGDDGADGTDGADGSDGADGAPGEDGATGPQGEQGIQGIQGIAGANAFISYNAFLSNLLDINGDCGSNGGSVYDVGTEGQEQTDVLIVCNGEDGTNGTDGINGADGLPGVDGKDGVTKTVIVHADGTVEETAPLPKTGSDDNTWMLGLAGLGILALGGGSLWVLRRQA